LRAAPSAGALYPIEIFAVLASGVYRYKPKTHSIERITDDDKRKELSEASGGQESIRKASISIVISAVYERLSVIFGKRAERYCAIEAGTIAENIYLQVESLKFGTMILGGFEDKDIQKVLGLKKSEKPLIVMPVGIPK
jgi:SagB-type dehydrogenase family enzyme